MTSWIFAIYSTPRVVTVVVRAGRARTWLLMMTALSSRMIHTIRPGVDKGLITQVAPGHRPPAPRVDDCLPVSRELDGRFVVQCLPAGRVWRSPGRVEGV